MTTSFATRRQAPPSDGDTIRWPAVIAVLIGMFMAILDSYIVIVAGPAVQADLHLTGGELQWVLAGYQLSYAVAMITAGRIADLVGRRRIFLIGTVVFVVTSLLCAVSPSGGLLIGARLLQGVGAAMVVPQVFTVITLVVPAAARARVFGLLGVVLGLATAGGQLLGGLLVGADLFGSGWRSIFAVNLPIGVAVLVLARRYVPESRAADARRLDLRGVFLLSVALFLLTYPLIQGREAGWPSWMWALLVACVPAFGAFVVAERAVERRGGDPLLRLRLFTQRSFSVGLALVIGVYALVTSYYLALSVTMQDGLGLSPLQAGLVYLPVAGCFFVFSLVAGRLVPRYGRRVLEAGAIVVAVGYLSTVLTLLIVDDISPAVLIPSLMLQSVGGGLLITPSLNAVLARIEPADVGMASGGLSTAQQVGAALGIAVVGGLFFRSFHPDGTHAAASHAFVVASLAVLTIALVVIALVYLMPRSRAGAKEAGS